MGNSSRRGPAAVLLADDEEHAKAAIIADALRERSPDLDALQVVADALRRAGTEELPRDSAAFYAFATGALYDVLCDAGGDESADALMGDVGRIWERMSACQREVRVSAALRGDELAGMAVLVVDDDPLALRALRRLLSSFGAEVHTAVDADDALEQALRISFDVVVADYDMPGGSGATLASSMPLALGANAPPVVCLTGVTPKPRRGAFAAVVTKPAHPGPLVWALVEAARG